MYGALGVEVHLDAATHVVGRRTYRYHLLGDVDADGQAFLVDMREMLLRLLRVFHRHVEAHVVETVDLHLVVYGACHDVAWRERQARVIFLHELRSVGQLEYSSISAHGLRDEEGRVRLRRVVEHGGVELHELHVFHRGLGAISHRYAVARGYFRV